MSNQLRAMLDEVQDEYRRLRRAKLTGRFKGEALLELNRRIEHTEDRIIKHQNIYDGNQLEIAVTDKVNTEKDELALLMDEIMAKKDDLIRNIPEDF